MSSYTSRQSTSPTKSLLTLDLSGVSVSRRTSAATTISNPSPTLTQRVQLIPHGRASSHDSCLTDLDKETISATYFDSKDISSKDFDFDDIFTYDRPQQKLSRVVEVSSPHRTSPNNQRDWSIFPPYYHGAAVGARHKVSSKSKGSTGDVYVRNAVEARKR